MRSKLLPRFEGPLFDVTYPTVGIRIEGVKFYDFKGEQIHTLDLLVTLARQAGENPKAPQNIVGEYCGDFSVLREFFALDGAEFARHP